MIIFAAHFLILFIMNYKLFLVLCFILWGVPFKISAQEWHFGLKSGFAIGTFNSEIGPWGEDALYYPYSQSARLGIGGGVFVNYAFNEYIGFQTELLYSPKGSTFERENPNIISINSSGGGANEKDRVKYCLDYIELPILLDVPLSRRFAVKVGFAPALNMISRMKINYWEKSNSKLKDEPPFNQINGDIVDEEYEKIDLDIAESFIVSSVLEVNYRFNNQYLFLNYYQSLTDVYEVAEMNGFNMKTKNYVVSLGYAIFF